MVIRENDPHQRMIAIHPMNGNGSAREFNSAVSMSFAVELHGRLLESLAFRKPAVNSEYGYYLRDQNGDGVPDKENSTTLEIMRHATWDIVMAGGYVVTGFGNTYFGGHRDPGPFHLDAEKNNAWENQIGHMKKLFTTLEWWRLRPHDALLHCRTPRGQDRMHLNRVAPPENAYWCLAEPGRQYLIYVRGVTEAVALEVANSERGGQARQFNPRTGEVTVAEFRREEDKLVYHPPDGQDWIVVFRPDVR
jgi:hypothetical protein